MQPNYDPNNPSNPPPDTDDRNWPLVDHLILSDGSILKIACPARGLVIGDNNRIVTDGAYLTALACNDAVKARPIPEAAHFVPGPNGQFYPWDKRAQGMGEDPGVVKYDAALDGPGWQEVPGQPGVWIQVATIAPDTIQDAVARLKLIQADLAAIKVHLGI